MSSTLESKFTKMKNTIDLNVGNFNTIYKKAKCHAVIMRLTIVTLSSAITLILALSFTYSTQIALFLSFLLTVIVSMNEFLNVTNRHREIRSKAAYFTKLKMEMDFLFFRQRQFQCSKTIVLQ